MPKNINWLDVELKKQFECKTSRLGGRKGTQQQLTILGRVLTWSTAGIEYEADPRHVKAIVKQLKLQEAKQ